MKLILPMNKESGVPIVITPHKEFVPCMAVLLQSILENANTSSFYDIIILHSEIPIDTQERLLRAFRDISNFSLRFYDVSKYILRYKFLKKMLKKKSLYITTYYRLLIPELLVNYDKVIYLDSDIVVNVDIAGILKFDCAEYMIGAVRDVCGNGEYYAADGILKKYRDEVLQLSSPNDYFNAGVLLFNIKKFADAFTPLQWWNFIESRVWKSNDQDILNVACAQKALLLPLTWNYITSFTTNSERYLTTKDREEREKVKNKPNVIHYVGTIRPWNYVNTPYFDIYWDYAKRSPFFEDAFNQIGEARLCDRVVEKSFEGRINRKTICKIIEGWLRFQIGRYLSYIKSLTIEKIIERKNNE